MVELAELDLLRASFLLHNVNCLVQKWQLHGESQRTVCEASQRRTPSQLSNAMGSFLPCLISRRWKPVVHSTRSAFNNNLCRRKCRSTYDKGVPLKLTRQLLENHEFKTPGSKQFHVPCLDVVSLPQFWKIFCNWNPFVHKMTSRFSVLPDKEHLCLCPNQHIQWLQFLNVCKTLVIFMEFIQDTSEAVKEEIPIAILNGVVAEV